MEINALTIKESRKNLNLKQSELAKLIGVSLKTIGNYEKGEAIPESKKEILRKVLFEKTINILNDDKYIYVKNSGYDKKIKDIKEEIYERKKIIELSSDKNQIEHQNKMISLLETQIELILNQKIIDPE